MSPLDRFYDKLIEKLDKIDNNTLKKYVLNLAYEKTMLFRVVDKIPEGIVIIDKHFEVFYVNKSARDILMISSYSLETLPEKIFSDSKLYNEIAENFGKSRQVLNKNIHILKPCPVEVLLSMFPVYNDGNEMEFYLISLRDIKIDEELEAVRKRENMESLLNLAAGLAHEIGNPLNTINIYLRIISAEAEKCGSDKITELINIISLETKRLDNMVKRFLKTAREGTLFFKKGNINECIKSAVNFFIHQINESGIELEVILDDSIPEMYIDSDRLYESFVNIIKNAIEAMPNGGKLRIESHLNDNLVTVGFRDTGYGIPEDIIPRIFEAYFTTKENGSGLGLMNVYKVIKDHRGRIDVESKVGEGTVFTITVPLRRRRLQLPESNKG